MKSTYPQSLDELRLAFLNRCTDRQKQCPHGQTHHPERCIQCVIDEGVATVAVNQMLTVGVTDATVDTYLETTGD